jgi:hypothetical protein
VKSPKLDGSSSWAVFNLQFEATVNHNVSTYKEKSVNLLAVSQEQAADILHSVPTGATYDDIVGALRAATKTTTQSQDPAELRSTTTFQQPFEWLAQWALVVLPMNFIERVCAFVDGVTDREVKRNLLMRGDSSLNEALNQVTKLEVSKATLGTPGRMAMRHLN